MVDLADNHTFYSVRSGTALAFRYTFSHDNENLKVSATKRDSKLNKFYILRL